MDRKLIDSLVLTAEDFGNIAKKVNDSSKTRKKHAETVINFIYKSLDIGEGLNHELKNVIKYNLEQRNQDNIVLSTCDIFKDNIEKQRAIIKELTSLNGLSTENIKKIVKYTDDFEKYVDDALINVESIIKKDNEIILMDKFLLSNKKSQQKSISVLNNLARVSLEDAENSIQGSYLNLERGLALVEKFKSVESLLEDGKVDELNTLVEDTNKGWNIAVDVNNSSKSQFEFAEKVNRYTEEFHNDSMIIKDMVIEKHNIFEQNLQTITVLTVILSLSFMNYLKLRDELDAIEPEENGKSQFHLLKTYVEIACQDIEELAALNYDMSESSHLYNEVETKTVDMTKKEVEYFGTIKVEVESMTNATEYPVEGSGKNIENGKEMENRLKQLISEL